MACQSADTTSSDRYQEICLLDIMLLKCDSLAYLSELLPWQACSRLLVLYAGRASAAHHRLVRRNRRHGPQPLTSPQKPSCKRQSPARSTGGSETLTGDQQVPPFSLREACKRDVALL